MGLTRLEGRGGGARRAFSFAATYPVVGYGCVSMVPER